MQKNYKKTKKNVLQRDNWKCKLCRSRENLQVHHIVFRSQGGSNEDWNLLTVCCHCHDAIHAHWIKILPLEGSEVVNANEGIRIILARGYLPGRAA